jgi:hypothetical protein
MTFGKGDSTSSLNRMNTQRQVRRNHGKKKAVKRVAGSGATSANVEDRLAISQGISNADLSRNATRMNTTVFDSSTASRTLVEVKIVPIPMGIVAN